MEGRKFEKFLRLFVLLALTVALVLAVGIMAFSQGTQAEEKECYLAGDMNADGELTSADAVYLYNHVKHGAAQYPVHQNADINGDGLVNEKDARALLYAFYEWKTEDTAHIGLMVHDYYEPVWTWTEDGDIVTAQVTTKCACSAPETLTVEDITLDTASGIEATCAATGQKVYNARVEVNGQTLTDRHTQILPALPHQAGAMVTTDMEQHYQLCTECGEKLNAANHAWEADGDIVKGDCQTQSTQHYICACGAEKTELLGVEAHAYAYEKDVLVNETNCTYAKQYRCTVCETATYQADEYTNHTYRTVITQQATCQNAGEKASKCDICGDVRSTEPIEANNHNWVEGAVVAGVRTDTCDVCSETKTTAVADGAVSKDTLNQSDEVTVGDATMSMDQDVKDNLDADRDIVLSAGTVDKDGLGLSEDQLDQIGENDVYDFNMVYDDSGEKVNFTGWITISLPYELADDEDIDAIDVWYIDENGNTVSCEATYNNGYITFKVEHFSYYTVTRLTPAERCGRYGHIWTDSSKLATCTTDGFTSEVCQRCNAVQNLVEIDATGHSYDDTSRTVVEAGCTSFGSVSDKCITCSFVTSEAIKPLGHDMHTATTDATCDASGKIVHSCSRCDYSREEVLPQLTHEYEHDATQDVIPTCTFGGWEVHVCKHCGGTVKKNEKPALGHNHHKDNAVWTWDPATEADPHVTVTCSNEGCEVTKELNPKVVVTEAGCETESSAVATVYYNGTKFEKSYAKGPALGHDMDTDNWYYNDGQHYRRCNRCGMQENAADHILESVDVEVEAGCTTDGLLVYSCSICAYTCEEVLPATGEHSMNAGEVTREPTCTLDGVKVYTCELCGYTERETLPATGHNFVDDVCTACGKINGCDHTEFSATKIELPDGVCKGRELYLISCICGDQQSLTIHSLECDFVWEEIYDEATGYTQQQRCVACGLTIEIESVGEIIEESCLQKITTKNVFVFNGVTLVEFVEYYEEAHPVFWNEGEILTDLGMCDLYVESGSCPCGEVQRTAWSESCNLVDYTCTECGVYRERIIEEVGYDGCDGYRDYTYIYLMGETELYRFTTRNVYDNHDEYAIDRLLLGENCEDGYATVYGCRNCDYVSYRFSWGHETFLEETYNLSEYGLCGGTVSIYGCLCGERNGFYREEMCRWEHQGTIEGSGEYYVCSECGARLIENNDIVWESDCVYTEYFTVTYQDANGETICTAAEFWTYENHEYVLTDSKLYGDSCEDGVQATYQCVRCGDSYFEEYYYHQTQVTRIYFGEESGICGLTICVEACLCGEEHYDTWAETNCTYVFDETYEDGEREYCEVCGSEYIRRGSRVEESECVYWEAWDYYYFNAAGERIYHWTKADRYETHDYTVDTKLLGENCEEGVEKTFNCNKCGDTFTETYYHHEMEYHHYALSDYGMCGGWLTAEACPCGQEYWSNWDFGCSFQHVDTVDGVEIYYCQDCETYMYLTGTYEPVSDCITDFIEIRELSNAFMGENTLRFGVRGRMHNHKWVYELTLMEGATSCTDGVIVKESCARCGQFWSEWEVYEHWTYILEREIISEGLLCGDVERLHYSCGCGQETSTEYEVNGCNYQYNGYDEALGCDTYLCSGCGTIRYVTTKTVPVEGAGCQKENITTYHYLRDGEEVLTYERSYFSYSHQYVAELTLLGVTCDDGYTVYQKCMYCDYGYDEGTYYGCNNWRINRIEGVTAEDGFCGDMYLNVYACACGQNGHTSLSTGCSNHNYVGEDEAGHGIYQCYDCGLMYIDYTTTERVPEDCKEIITRTIVFMKQEGEERVTVAAIEGVVTRISHTYLHDFEMQGETCDDGYTVYRYCKYCDYRQEWSTSEGCMTWLVDVEIKLNDEAYCSAVYEYYYSCACGEYFQSDRGWSGNCSFEWVYNETLDRWVDTCTECGLTYTTESFNEVIDPNTPCYTMNGTRYTYYAQDGTVLCTVDDDWRSESHTYLNTFQMLGTTCEDGYVAYAACAYCDYGYERGTFYGCQTWLINIETKLNDEAYCSAAYEYYYSCACGEYFHSDRVWSSNCFFEYVYNETLERWVDTCTKCGLIITSEGFSEAIDPAVPCFTMNGTRYTYYKADGTVLCTVIDNWRSESHTYLNTFEMLGATCEDGYVVYANCAYCDDGYERGTFYGCQTWLIRLETKLNDEAYCSAVYEYYYNCACGASGQSDRVTSGNCTFEYVYNEALERWAYTCTECGLTYTEESFNEVIDPNKPCYMMNGTRYTYYAQDGTVLCTVDDDWRSANHNWLHSFELLGDTCDDGYYVIRNCVDCGYTNRDEMINTGCMIHRVRTETVLEGDKYGYCGDVLQHYNSCACGAHTSMSYSSSGKCSFQWVYKDTLQEYVYECSTCGLIYQTEQVHQVIDPEKPCYYLAGTRYHFYDADGNWLCTTENTWENVEHTYMASFQMHGTTCDEGYTVYYDCLYCDSSDATKSSGCMTYRTARYDLTAYGLCGGYVDYNNCPCGKNSTVNWDIACDYTWLDELEMGNQYRYCADCDTKFCFGNWAETNREECTYVTTYFLKAYRNDVIVADVQWQTRRDEHTYLMVGYEGDCESSVTAFMECKYCGKENTNYGYGGHYTFMTGFIDLEAAGACGGYVQKYQCACGQYESYEVYNTYNCSFSYSDEQEIQPDGNILYKQTRTCSKCGLEIYEQWTTTRDAATCQQITVRSIFVYMNGEWLGEFTEREVNTSHNYGEVVWELENPAGTCEDGLVGVRICADCGATEDYWTSGHSYNVVESIDLSQYGSACGCYLKHYCCPCGKYQNYQIGGECDLDQNRTDLWIEDALNGTQYTTEGQYWFDYYSYTYTCAVTSPQCGLKVRMAGYWLQEGCEAVRYQTWQLGCVYDETTGQWTWDREVTIATGERGTYHNYEQTYTRNDETTGNYTETYSYVCTICASSYVEKNQYKNWRHVGSERTAINKLNNGQNQFWSEIWEAGFEHKDSFYRTYEKSMYIRADGSESWNEYTYEYQLTNGCKRVTTWKNSDGGSNSYETEHPYGYVQWEWVEYPTCSQTGLEKEIHRCSLCETITYEYTYAREPYGHMWYMDPDTGIYECGRCGLENINGADGTIIMEDLTAQYGNNTDYVVGYWNHGMDSYTPYATVVLLDANGEELLLENIAFTYWTKDVNGIQAIVANKAEIQQAAAAAMQAAGYTGNFAIRITFVPDSGDSDLDYAITFDSQTAGGNP